MRVFTAALLLAPAMILPAAAVSIPMTPPPKVLPQAQPAPKPQIQTKVPAKNQPQAKPDCPCNCPQARRTQHRAATHRTAHAGYRAYRYAAAAPFVWRWRGANEAYMPSPMAYGPPRNLAYEQGLHIENEGWSGGVGYGAEGGGGFADGYGQAHFANGGGVENGPTYNDYNQSSQFNPSQPGPFQPRLMGGFAPPSGSGSR